MIVHRPRVAFLAACLLALACAAPAQAAHDVTVVPDAAAIRPTQLLGFTISVRSPRRAALASDLPAGGDLSWGLDDQDGIAGCAVSGPVGRQRLGARGRIAPTACTSSATRGTPRRPR
jgi:hypothetical protein